MKDAVPTFQNFNQDGPNAGRLSSDSRNLGRIADPAMKHGATEDISGSDCPTTARRPFAAQVLIRLSVSGVANERSSSPSATAPRIPVRRGLDREEIQAQATRCPPGFWGLVAFGALV
jgi:hypothetical protein